MRHEKGLLNWLKLSTITMASFGNHYDWVLFKDLFKSTDLNSLNTSQTGQLTLQVCIFQKGSPK